MRNAAGALWTPLFSDSNFAESIGSLIGQIAAAVGAVATEMPDAHADSCDTDPSSLDLFSREEMREELERLRAEGTRPELHTATTGGECALPAIIPELQDCLVTSDLMRTLVDTVVSSSSRRCGFWGSGGVGKTTTSAWLCRQERVRRHFSQIVWVTVGQTPNTLACQRQLFHQLTGGELALDLSPSAPPGAFKRPSRFPM